MRRLILFDIDGTLVNCPPDTAPVAAIRHLYGLEVSLEGHKTGGMTEPEILTFLLHDGGWNESQIKKELPTLMKAMDSYCAQKFKNGSIKLLEGVRNLLEELQRHNVALGLITGNRTSMARLKLEDVGIWHYFPVGGFGDDPHEKRSDLIKIAAERANFTLNDPGVYVIGDTWRDIKAAVEAGVTNRVGLISPRHPKEEFEEAGATVILSGLSDTRQVLSALNILT